jgi:hypothetical protein
VTPTAASRESARERSPNGSGRLRSWLFFSLGLNAALLGSVAWLAWGRAASGSSSAVPAPEGFPPDFMARPPRQGGFPPAFLLRRLRDMASEAGVGDRQWAEKIEPALEAVDGEFLAKIEAMRRSRLETARAVVADPGADLDRLAEESLRAHAEAERLVLEHLARVAGLLEPAQREALAAMIDKKLEPFGAEGAASSSSSSSGAERPPSP